MPTNPHPTLTLTQPLADAIIAHARAGKPQEVCGLVRGRVSRATEVHPAPNVASNPLLDYVVEPNAMLAVFDWEDADDELVAIYHSHPFSPAYPSGSDAINAYYPDSVYLICSLQHDQRPVLNGFFLREAEGRFNVDDLRDVLDFYETRPGRWVGYIPTDAPLPPGLADLDRPADTALYVVFERYEDVIESRAVSVQPVEIRIEPI
ncbi:MAG: M67 family metallopeptidase [Caldilineales bacterium]|nr:M67 family metallopeptidase [Caldilineales bacterium]